MKKVFVLALLLVFCAAASSFAWTGRMAGMGNPYGLVEDESDFLTHPTAITQGKGWQFYGDLGINWTNTTKWDWTFAGFNILGGPMSGVNTKAFNGDGHEWMTDASFGFTFPVNTGRMGVFFNYSGNVFSRTKTDGTAYATFSQTNPFPFYGDYSLKNNTDAYGFKVLYAQPFTDKVKFGGEFGIARRIEKRENDFNSNWTVTGAPYPIYSWSAQNDPAAYRFGNLFPFQMPYDSKYWETTMKASVEGNIGPSNLKFTAFGGFIFSGENNYTYAMRSLVQGNWVPFGPYDFTRAQSRQGSMEGNVTGWNIGAEAWWRFHVAKDIQLPFVVRAEYAKKSRTGDGYGSTPLDPFNYVAYVYRTLYDNNVKTFTFDIGGGVDYRISKSCGIAAGLYYTYTDEKTDFSFTEHAYGIQAGPSFIPFPAGIYPPNYSTYGGYPEMKEHKLTLKFAGNFQVAPRVSLNTGLNFFYGWITTGNYDRTLGPAYMIPSLPLPLTSNYSLDGYQWGIGAAFGATIAFNGFSFEPYIKGGYRKLNISGDGTDSAILPDGRVFPLIGGSTDIHKTQWNVGGGFAVKF